MVPEEDVKNTELDSNKIEKRFVDFLYSKFGKMIGNMLLTAQLAKKEITSISDLKNGDQIKFMDETLTEMFKKHGLGTSSEHVRLELKMQLCLDKMSEMVSKELNMNVTIDNLNITYQDFEGFDGFMPAPNREEHWCSIGNFMSKNISAKTYIFTEGTKSLRFLIEYARIKNLNLSVTENEKKYKIFHQFLHLLIQSFDEVLDERYKHEVSYEINSTYVVTDSFIENIIRSITLYEQVTNMRSKVTSIQFKLQIGNTDFGGTIFLIY